MFDALIIILRQMENKIAFTISNHDELEGIFNAGGELMYLLPCFR